MKKTIKYISTFSLAIILLLSFPAEVYAASIDNADTVGNWSSSDTTNFTASQETTLKQEGTGSVKLAATASTLTTVDMMEYASDNDAQTAYVTNASGLDASGGTETTSEGDKIHTFTSSGTFTVTGSGGDVECLVVAGGGQGGPWTGGGGGGGGVLYDAAYSVTATAYPVTVGAGGTGGGDISNPGGYGTKGSNSVFETMTAIGGGGGGSNTGPYGTNLDGGSGGGGGHNSGAGGTATSGQGYDGSTTTSTSPNYGAGGGGGAGATGNDGTNTVGGAGGAGASYSISGSAVTYAGGGGGGVYAGGTAGAGGAGGGGRGGSNAQGAPVAGTANTGGGGGGQYTNIVSVGAAGGSGVVIISYPTFLLQSYSEASLKTQGSYALKGIASATTSLNKTLTRTVSSTVDLSDINTIGFDIRSTRTGSNIKIGIHDSGGTTTEITPNITSADTFQEVDWDISGVSNANKDAIDQIIITIVNADSANTFYIDNMSTGSDKSLNDTATVTKSTTDLSAVVSILFWVRSDRTGGFMRFQMGESASSEQTYDITINAANTWERKTWDITGITNTDIDAVTKYAFKTTNADSDFIFYFDDVNSNISCSPNLGESSHTIVAGCTFTGYTDAEDDTRVVSGLDVGSSTTNSSVLYVQSNTLSIASNETMVVGSIEMTGGSIALANGGTILVDGSLWAVDKDADDYPAEAEYYARSTTLTDGVRLNTISAYVNDPDCDDNTYSLSNLCGPTRYGDGRDGVRTIASNTDINTADTPGRTCTEGGDAVNYSVSSLTSNTAVLSTTPSSGCLAVGDYVLLINLQGTSSSSVNTGNYELLEIDSISTNTITFPYDKVNYYGSGASNDSGLGTGDAQNVMLQRVPQYSNVTVNSGIEFYPSIWDGSKNGVMAFKANGTLTVNGIIYRANSYGYRTSTVGAGYTDGGESFCNEDGGGDGGDYDNVPPDEVGLCGGGGGAGNWGPLGTIEAGSIGSSTGGAGGGAGAAVGSAWARGGGGGGGGYGSIGYGGITYAGGAGDGTNGGTNTSGTGGQSASGGASKWAVSGGGGGGGTYGQAALTQLFLGSSGGTGGNAGAGNGGAGGGIILIYADTITLSSAGGVRISNNGNNGGNGGSGSWAVGAGGGGSGGSIKLIGKTITLETSKVTSTAGNGGWAEYGSGGNGGSGRIRVEYETSLSGTTNPAASTTQL